MARVTDGAVLVMSFDGDAVHMAQIVLQMAAGQVPHLDFQTPLGAMAFLPIVRLMKLGFGIGSAFAYAPIYIGMVALPAVYWVGISRFSTAGALAFGTVFFVQLLAYVHGGTDATVAFSMYYNNWCWAISMLAVVLAVLPNNRNTAFARWVEPFILGACVGFLVLSKATFGVFLLPAICLALLVSNRVQDLVFAVFWAVLFLTAVTLPLGGISYWQGYIGDLLFVAGSKSRAMPGDPLALMLLAPGQIVGNLALLASMLMLRQARMSKESLVFLFLAAGWALVTYQNWQNDPHWLIPAGLILWVLSGPVVLFNRYGWPLQTALRNVAVVLMALGAPLLVTQAQSLLIHSGLNADKFEPIFATGPNSDLRFRTLRGGNYRVDQANVALAPSGAAPTVWKGETLPDCQKTNGLLADMVATGRALDKEEQTRGAQVLYADWLNALSLFSAVKPIQGGAPWYYGGKPGFAAADFLVVPLCPMGQDIRRVMLAEIEKDPTLAFEEVSRNALFILLKKRD
jgi:hypothetical protein